MDDHMPPPHVIAEWSKHCDCCPQCQDHPCAGVQAGGMCDQMECQCFGSYEDNDDEGES